MAAKARLMCLIRVIKAQNLDALHPKNRFVIKPAAVVDWRCGLGCLTF